MSLTTIQETVQRAAGDIPRGYEDRVTRVVDAVTEREYVLTERAVEAAVSQGVGERDARNIVENIGLTFRPAPVAAASSNGDASLDERMDNLLTEVTNLRDEVRGLRR